MCAAGPAGGHPQGSGERDKSVGHSDGRRAGGSGGGQGLSGAGARAAVPSGLVGLAAGDVALAAGGVARARCGRSAWVLDLASRHYVDRLDPACLMRAVRPHTDGKGVVRYMDRWLNAPAHLADGTLEPREPGTPHGSVVSPRWATLFWHDAFDLWRQRP